MKQFTNFRTFKKAVRKFWKRHATMHRWYSNLLQRRVTSWMLSKVWCYYLLSDASELEDQSKLDWFNYDVDPESLPEFINVHSKMLGKNVNVYQFGRELSASGCFVGFALVNNGVLFAVDNKDTRQFLPLHLKLELKK